MASISETGHAKNVTNFKALLLACAGHEAEYNPSRESITIAAMQTLSVRAADALGEVSSAQAVLSIASAARESAFKPLSRLATRVVNALRASGATRQERDNVRSVVRKIQGKRATPKKTEEEKKALAAEDKEEREISTSQMGYVNRLDNVNRLIKLLAGIACYTPHEPDLNVAGLTAFYNDLEAKNNAAVSAFTALGRARIARDGILYARGTGLVDVASGAKAYIKAVYGAKSPQFRQVSKLDFRIPKK